MQMCFIEFTLQKGKVKLIGRCLINKREDHEMYEYMIFHGLIKGTFILFFLIYLKTRRPR